MPTHEELPRFLRDWRALRSDQREAFLSALSLFVAGVDARAFDPRLRVKRVRGYGGVWEMTWANDGRATFSYGPEVVSGQAHIVWRRVGTHRVFGRP